MQTLARLFGRSPFAPLQIHMSKVAECVKEIPRLFEALKQKDYAILESLVDNLSKLEHDADLAKNDIRNHLPTGLFLPIGRENILEIVSLQDNIADAAEDIGILMTLRQLEFNPLFTQEVVDLLTLNIEAFHGVLEVTQEFGELVESSFGGSEAEKVVNMIEKVSLKEHESDVLQHKLLKKFFAECGDFHYQDFFLWLKIFQKISCLSDESEKLANRIRMLLEVK